jgi:hypothetical protein
VRELKRLIELGKQMKRDHHLVQEVAAKWLRIRDRNGRPVPLIANAAQLQYESRRGPKNIVLKARQMGMTTWIAARFFLRTITTPGTLTLLVAHNRESAEAIFRLVQRMWQELPQDVCEGPLQRSRANVGQMVFPELDSEFRIASASDENAGRGLSVQNLHCSEVSRWPGDAAATLAGLRAALVPGGEMVLESTPNGAYGAFYNEWLSGVEDGDALVRHFLPWWLEPAYVGPAVDVDRMSKEELDLLHRHGLSLAQIGFRRELEARYGGLRSQEFAEDAESCFRTTGMCCFDLESIERRLISLHTEPQQRHAGALQIWLPPSVGREYIVAVDSAGGGGEGDFAAAQVVELTTGLQCAELQQRLRPVELARAAAELATEYNRAVVAVERNNHGAAVLAYLETRERYDRIWCGGRQRGEPGWLTTASSKPEMIARLGSLLLESPERFYSRRLLAECRTFVAAENGRTGAIGGAHDDLVMAMAVAHAVRAELLSQRRVAA